MPRSRSRRRNHKLPPLSPSPAPSWGPSPRSSPSPSCPRPTESHQRLWGERDVRPTILERPRSATATVHAYPMREGRQAVAKKARGGVVGTAASFVSGIAAFTRREQDGNAGLAARGAWAPAPSFFFFFFLACYYIFVFETETDMYGYGYGDNVHCIQTNTTDKQRQTTNIQHINPQSINNQ